VYFRDHELSDRIGFVYASWDPVHAAEDLVARLKGIREQLGPRVEADACVSIILDGENCWEYYPDSGVGFLDRFYQLLASSPGLETIRMGDVKARPADPPSLAHVVPGSWIDANFDTWIGAAEKNRAWMLLNLARRKLALEAPHAEVPREFYKAEGSDWFWWLGPGHESPYEASYENLFRTNLIQGLAKAKLGIPEALRVATITAPSLLFQPPTHLFTPTVDGRKGSYYDWIAAGRFRASAGSIHRTDRYLGEVRFGFDLRNLYLRIEGNLAVLRDEPDAVSVVVEFQQPRLQRLVFQQGKVRLFGEDGGERPTAAVAAIESIFELALPREDLGGREGDLVEFSVSLAIKDEIVDSLPASGHVILPIPSADFDLQNWSV
jgi:hypothetical protein